MAQPSINIRHFRIDSIAIRPRESFDAELPVICQIGVQFSVAGHPESENVFKVELQLRFHDEGLKRPPNFPYETAIDLEAFFDTRVTVSADAVPAPLVLNALTILYGVARGYLGAMTASHEHGQFVIPAIIFDGMVERAARTNGSNVVPTPDSIGPRDPAAGPLFRFLFAIEDLSRYGELVEDPDQRSSLIEGINQLIETLNKHAGSKGASLQDCLKALDHVKQRIHPVDRALAEVLNFQVAFIADGLGRARIEADRPSAPVASLSGTFAPEQVRTPVPRKKRARSPHR